MAKAPIKSIDQKNEESAAMQKFSEDAVAEQQKSRNEHEERRNKKGMEFLSEKFAHLNRQRKILER